MPSSRPRLAYLTSQFPELHETFLLDEVRGLEQNSLDIEIFSIFPCADAVVHGRASEIRGPIDSLSPYGPRACVSALGTALRRSDENNKERILTPRNPHCVGTHVPASSGQAQMCAFNP